MTFEELLEEVYTITNRPDKVAETKSAVKAATLKAHQQDFFSKDIVELLVTLGTTAAYVWSFDVISYISNYRKVAYMRKYDTVNLVPGDFINEITPDEVLDAYGYTKTDVVYTAGRNLEIKSSTLITKVILAAYVSPIVTEVGYSSWVADLYPYAIIFDSARVVFKSIGFDEQSATYRDLAAEQFELLKINAI